MIAVKKIGNYGRCVSCGSNNDLFCIVPSEISHVTINNNEVDDKGQILICRECCKALQDRIARALEMDENVTVPFSWLVKFCSHIDFKEPLTDAEREKLWRQKLLQQFGIKAEEGGGK